MPMRIALVSRVWPADERSGVALCAALHARLLREAGHDVLLVGAGRGEGELVPGFDSRRVAAAGSGSLYAPARMDRTAASGLLAAARPDLLVIEGWQTALTDGFLDLAHRHGVPVLAVSHGVAVTPYAEGIKWRLRAAAWWPYRRFVLPRLIDRAAAVTALDGSAASPRFLDRDLARARGKRVVVLPNAPVNWDPRRSAFASRDRQLVCTGYFSPVKNQLSLIRAAPRFAAAGLRLLLIGARHGAYFDRCVAEVRRLGLHGHVVFRDDRECSVAEEVARSLLVLSASLTEVLPLTLIEGMASGTPFAATRVGAVGQLAGGLVVARASGVADAVESLLRDPDRWASLAAQGVADFERRFTVDVVRSALAQAVDAAVGVPARAPESD